MRAARLHAYGKPLVVEEIPTPRPGPKQVLVRVAGAGFCHSDLHVIDGEIPILPRLPVVLGHENAGHVSAVGEGVTSVREGDAVLVFGGWGCGSCGICIGGDEQLCEKPHWGGLSEYDGGYAQYLLVPEERYLIKLAKLDPKLAAPLADAVLTPYRAIKKALPYLSPDRAALVIGVGGLGQYGIKLLRILSGCEIIAVDVSPEKLRIAKELGATYTINAKVPELGKTILSLTGGHGVGTVFDFVGSEQSLELAISTTASLGKISQIGLGGGTAHLKVLTNSRFEVAFETTLWGSIKELREVVALVESGRLTLLETEQLPLERIGEAYTRLKAGEVRGRLVITPNG